LEELGLMPASPRAEESFQPLQADEATVLTAMGYEPIDADTLCERTGLTPATASAILLKLELDGHLSRLPGGLLQRMR
jgi:DNA processing protein